MTSLQSVSGKKWCVFFFLLFVGIQPAWSQKKAADPRPLKGLDRSSIPTYRSVEEFLGLQPTHDLKARARVVGQATLTANTVNGRKPDAAVALEQINRNQKTLDLQISRAENGTIRWMKGNMGSLQELVPGFAPGKKASTADLNEAAVSMMRRNALSMRVKEPDREFKLESSDEDDDGRVHLRFAQQYRGIPVWGREIRVHFDENQSLYLVNGSYEPTPNLSSVTPELNPEVALQRVVTDLSAQNRLATMANDVKKFLGYGEPEVNLVIYPRTSTDARLAYEVSLHPNLMEYYTYLIDAGNGSVLNRISRHCTVNHDKELPVVSSVSMAPVPAAAGTMRDRFVTAYEAVDLNNETHSIRTYQHFDANHYLVWDLPNLDGVSSKLPDGPVGGGLTISANNTEMGENVQLIHVVSVDNRWPDKASVSAHYNMFLAYSYYNSTFNRKAINGADESIISIVHVSQNGHGMDNAVWNGRAMIYGDGYESNTPLAGALDVAGHEMTHGVIQHTAGLIYQFQSGALNESMADVFGIMLDRDDFLLGEDIMKPGFGIAVRDLANPANPNLRRQQPAHMSEFAVMDANTDNGGVHINSGITNRAAYLIIQALGHEAAEQIYYQALTKYLTRNSQFIDARYAIEQAAADKYGNAAVSVVRQAFDAVGITGQPTDGNDDDVDPVTDGNSLITFMNEDGQIGVLDVTNWNAIQSGYYSDPNARARVDTDRSDYAQLSTPRNGEDIWFVNPDGKLSFINVKTGQVSVFDQLYIQQQGDLWNASIDPNANFVTLVSAYSYDPTLYVFDGTNLGAIELKPETTQEGYQDETIQYPDVVSWSPNAQIPRIAFDAYNEVDLGTNDTPISYWSIYEIDFESEKIFNLIPAQPTELSVGNIAYSNTDPDIVAFNLFDYQGNWDVLIGNFETGALNQLGLSNYTVGGSKVTDAQRPTFSPNDDLFAITSPAMGLMLFYEFESGDLTYLNFNEPIYNPRWFVGDGDSGTDTDDSTELPEAIALNNYPDPFNPATTVHFELPQSGLVDLKVFDVLGREIRTLLHENRTAGQHSVAFDAAGLSSGVYLARIEVNGSVLTRKMMLLK